MAEGRRPAYVRIWAKASLRALYPSQGGWHTVQVALYFRGLLSIRGHLVKMPSKCSLLVQKPYVFSFGQLSCVNLFIYGHGENLLFKYTF